MAQIHAPEQKHIEDLLEMWHEFMDYHRELRTDAYRLREDADQKIRDRFREYMNHDDRMVLIMTGDRNPDTGGFAVARLEGPSDVFTRNKRARITDFYLRPAYRGENMGRKLVEQIKQWAKNRDAEAVFMAIDARNEEGRGFWEALNFEKTREVYLEYLSPDGGKE